MCVLSVVSLCHLSSVFFIYCMPRDFNLWLSPVKVSVSGPLSCHHPFFADNCDRRLGHLEHLRSRLWHVLVTSCPKKWLTTEKKTVKCSPKPVQEKNNRQKLSHVQGSTKLPTNSCCSFTPLFPAAVTASLLPPQCHSLAWQHILHHLLHLLPDDQKIMSNEHGHGDSIFFGDIKFGCFNILGLKFKT